jgi:hypothetical protein
MQTGERYAVVLEEYQQGACKVGYTKSGASEGWLLVQGESDAGSQEWTTQFGALNFQALVNVEEAGATLVIDDNHIVLEPRVKSPAAPSFYATPTR